VTGRLKYICGEEGIRHSEAGIELVVDLNQGVMRDSVAMLHSINCVHKELTTTSIETFVGLSKGLDLRLIDIVCGGDQDQLKKFLLECENTAVDYGWLCRYIIRNLRARWLELKGALSDVYFEIPGPASIFLMKHFITACNEISRNEFQFHGFAIGMVRTQREMAKVGVVTRLMEKA